MSESNSLNTEFVIRKLAEGETIDEASIASVNTNDGLNNLVVDIEKFFKTTSTPIKSQNKLAIEIGTDSGLLSKKLNGQREFKKDELIAICLVLGYDIYKTQETLKNLGFALHSRDARDFEIMKGISANITLDEMEHVLCEKDMKLIRKG